jgi:hypothetical protein
MTDRTHPDSGRIITSGDVINDLHDHIAKLEAQVEALTTAQAGVPADEDEALDLLAEMFDAWENAPQCYEDPESQAGYLGQAFMLDHVTFHRCAELLNRRRPNKKAAPQPAQQGTALPDFDELGDDLIDAACAAGALYRVDLMRAWNVLREAGCTMRTAQHVGALQDQGKSNSDMADAWIEVTKALNEVAPDWALNSRTGVDSATAAIRKLADRDAAALAAQEGK